MIRTLISEELLTAASKLKDLNQVFRRDSFPCHQQIIQAYVLNCADKSS
jgi:hypothetical protein